MKDQVRNLLIELREENEKLSYILNDSSKKLEFEEYIKKVTIYNHNLKTIKSLKKILLS